MTPPKPQSIENQQLHGIQANSAKLDHLITISEQTLAKQACIIDLLRDFIGDTEPKMQAILDGVNAIIAAEQPEPQTASAAIAFGGNMPAIPGTLAVGSTLQASFVGLLADGTVNTATTVSTPPTWASSDASVATVDANGLVTGVGAGAATITATGGSFTDADGTVVGPLDASNTVSDTAPVARTVSAQINFA